MIRRLLMIAALAATGAAVAQPPTKPKLVVVISVDQFSADLFAEYRAHFTGGLKRLSQGVVFPSGYQSHAATETCPGHSTILTGDRPARTGIVANRWIDQSVVRDDKRIYCAEDERIAGTASADGKYVPSLYHLRAGVQAMGERMKASGTSPGTRVVAVAGKDRAAIMMGGRDTDEMWFLEAGKKDRFVTLGKPGEATEPAAVSAVNARLKSDLARASTALAVPAVCAAHAVPFALSDAITVGTGRFARKAGDVDSFRASPALDAATLDLASGFVRAMKLGQQASTDLLILGLSATDYVGHRYGTEGSEMCIQLMALDARLDLFFKTLDRARVDYIVALTADHGGHDIPERNRGHALPDAERLIGELSVERISAALVDEFKLAGPALRAAELNAVSIDASVPKRLRAQVLRRAIALFAASAQVERVFEPAEIAATPLPSTPPETWTLAQRVKASWDPARSGDLIVMLKPRVTPITEKTAAEGTYVATHGSPWDYDRRVPILFWRKGMAGFEQPNSIETVDIAPTLAATIGLPIAPEAIDGRCRELVPGAAACPPDRKWYIGLDGAVSPAPPRPR